MSGSLAGKLALVTGGTRGIGRATALRLRAAGAEVVVTGTRPGSLPPDGCRFEQIDFTDATATASFADQVAGWGVDILINNAGINKVSSFELIDPADFLRIQQVNVTAPFLMARAVVPGMRVRNWGRIVTISSVWGKIAREGRASYAASKFAVDGMNAALAAEVAQYGILANCVAPGFIDTELTRSVLGDAGISALVAQVPARRLGTPEEIAVFVAWLASPENTYISGQNIAIDGGFTRV